MITAVRQHLIAELIQSYQQVRQLFIKQLQAGFKDQANQGCFTVLKVLKKHGPLSQHAIAKELFHSDAAVSRQIKLLLKQKYISSSTDSTNRRRTIIKLTKQGSKILDAFHTTVHREVAKLLTDLSDAKLKQFIASNQALQQLIINKQSQSHD